MYRISSRARAACALCLVSAVLWSGQARAGLIMVIDPSIKVDRVRELSVDEGNLVVLLASGAKKTIKLPPGAMEHVAAWAADAAEGPMIVSMDGSFVSSGKNYTPAGVSRELGGALFYYDVFAHQLALGGVPQNLRSHPLVVRQGESALPSAQFKLLMDRANTSERALWFRRLAQRYEYPVIHPIGEFSLRATDSAGEYPVKIEVSSWLTFYPRLWYSPISVPAAWDNTAAMIPYGPLQKDMEEHWSDYRKAFRQMDELTSIFEAYTVLKLAKRDNAKLWNAFRVRHVTGVLPKVEFEGAELQDTGWRGDRDTLLAWVGLCRSAIGTKIETTHQANLALSLMGTYKWSKIEPEAEAGWKKEIAELAKRNPNLEAKLVLAGCLRADPAGDEVAESIERFLKIVRQSPDLFRLRVQGIHRLARLGPKLSGRAEAMLRAERRAVLADFHNQVAGAVSRHDTDLFVWENLIQDVYSTDLIEDAKATSEGGAFLEFMRDLATIHYHRGMAPQVGREVTLIHAHYRFLRYVADVVEGQNPGDDLLGQIRTWRGELAAKMGLKERKE